MKVVFKRSEPARLTIWGRLPESTTIFRHIDISGHLKLCPIHPQSLPLIAKLHPFHRPNPASRIRIPRLHKTSEIVLKRLRLSRIGVQDGTDIKTSQHERIFWIKRPTEIETVETKEDCKFVVPGIIPSVGVGNI
jgi:hypothetical protein